MLKLIGYVPERMAGGIVRNAKRKRNKWGRGPCLCRSLLAGHPASWPNFASTIDPYITIANAIVNVLFSLY